MNINKSVDGEFNVSVKQEDKVMAVSKATIGCIKSKDSKQFMEDIKNTKLNSDIILECQELIKELMKAKEKNI